MTRSIRLVSGAIAGGCIVMGSVGCTTSSRTAGVRSSRGMTVRTTAYTHNERDHRKYGRMTAAGTRLKYGNVRSAAADWSRFPVGTRFKIRGEPHLYVVEDYGNALVGTSTIDLYTPSFRSMNRWGVRNVPIEIVQWGSYDQSLKIMKPRSRHPHVREMVRSIEKRG